MKVSRRNLGNKPHHGEGQWGHPHRMQGLMSGEHLAQRVNRGYDDRKGYKGSAQADFGSNHSGRAPKINREAGHCHPIGHGSSRQFSEDTADTRRMNREVTARSGTERRNGSYTGKPPRGDTNVRKGPVGNAKGSGPPGIGKGRGVRGSPDTHLGKAGRGVPGRLGKHDGYKGKPTALTEDMSHEAFEKLGAD